MESSLLSELNDSIQQPRFTAAEPLSRNGVPPRPEENGPCDVSIVVPTYREAENLGVLVPRIAAELDRAGLRGEIIVVDDNSPDATPAVCAALAGTYPLRLCVRRTERGLSTAVIHGLRQARGRVLLVMDADLSHPPEKIAELVAAVEQPDVEFAIGSRYVPGASTDEHWGLLRWLNSKVATLLSRPLTAANDPMAGFFALRNSTFERADRLDPVGYKIGLELIVKCHCRIIREVPIHFSDRLHGQSKLSFKEQINYLVHLKRLMAYKYETALQALQFAVVGSTGLAIDLLSMAALLVLLPFGAARALAVWIAMTWNFVLNRHITFADSPRRAIVPQYLKFCGCCLGGAAVNVAVSQTLVTLSGTLAAHPLWAAAAGVIAGYVVNFATCRIWAFGSARDKARGAGF